MSTMRRLRSSARGGGVPGDGDVARRYRRRAGRARRPWLSPRRARRRCAWTSPVRRSAGSAASIGLSTESSELRLRAPQFKNTGNLARLLANLGGGVLRFGGESADNRHFTGTTAATLQGPGEPGARGRLVGPLHREPRPLQRGAGPRRRQGGRPRPRQQPVRLRLRQRARPVRADRPAPARLDRGRLPDRGARLLPRHPLRRAAGAARRSRRQLSPDPARPPFASAGREHHQLVQPRTSTRSAAAGCTATAASLAARMLSAAHGRGGGRQVRTSTPGSPRSPGARWCWRRPATSAVAASTGVSDSFASALWVIDYLLTGAEHGVHANELLHRVLPPCTTYTVLCLNGDNNYPPSRSTTACC